MRRFLLDSNVMGDFIDRRRGVPEKVRQTRQGGGRIGTCMPVVAELFYGVEFSATRDDNIRRLRRALSDIICWPLDRPAAEEYGRIAAELRRRGRPMQVVDVMIAAIALSLGDCTVVTCDNDLLSVPGLAVENWRTEGGTA
ncbi:MAG TPA: type II toxin-antitoxin system VapC family toxin [Gemmataceae bacterium]|nr:type II toxin-antitoxin system VapC family toxin [Gemmataceae bacterium]